MEEWGKRERESGRGIESRGGGSGRVGNERVGGRLVRREGEEAWKRGMKRKSGREMEGERMGDAEGGRGG